MRLCLVGVEPRPLTALEIIRRSLVLDVGNMLLKHSWLIYYDVSRTRFPQVDVDRFFRHVPYIAVNLQSLRNAFTQTTDDVITNASAKHFQKFAAVFTSVQYMAWNSTKSDEYDAFLVVGKYRASRGC